MTLIENILVPTIPTGCATRTDLERAKNLLARFGLAERAGSRVDVLSGGERQRAAIARALILDPTVLLFDEPTAHLDTENAQLTMDVLTTLHREGRTIVLATHDPRLRPLDLNGTIELEDGRARLSTCE